MVISKVEKIVSGQALAQVDLNDKVSDACKVMCDLDVGATVVLDGQNLVGVLSERDVIRKCICSGLHVTETPVSQIMTSEVKTIDADGSLADAIEIMKQGGFHHVPVLREGLVVGMLSNDDIPEEYRMLLERFKEIRGGFNGRVSE